MLPARVRASTGPFGGQVAVVDIGTNSVLLLVARRDATGALRALVDEATVTRLGAGVDRTQRLDDAPMARTLACLRQYAERSRLENVAEMEAVATSALRDATNGSAFLDEAEQILGTRPRVVTGHDEAVLTFEGALGGLGLARCEVTVCDLGGGSTEIVAGSWQGHGLPAVHSVQSFDLGCVRATERHLRGDPPAARELAELRAEARAQLGAWHGARTDLVVAVGGTATSLAALVGDVVPYDHARIHGSRLTRRSLARALECLCALPLTERKQLSALEPRRADVIVAGAVLLDEVARELGASELRVSDRGLRWGMAERMVSGRPVAD